MNTTISHSNHSRVQKFGRGSRILRSASPLSDDQIRNVAPSIFANQAHGSRSSRYSYIPTSEVLKKRTPELPTARAFRLIYVPGSTV